jgi:hypothetical protein
MLRERSRLPQRVSDSAAIRSGPVRKPKSKPHMPNESSQSETLPAEIVPGSKTIRDLVRHRESLSDEAIQYCRCGEMDGFARGCERTALAPTRVLAMTAN